MGAGSESPRYRSQVEDGAWREARLAAPVDIDTWRQWVVQWDATPGEHVITTRAADRSGDFQTAERAPVFPSGATGHHTIDVRVA